MNLPLGAILMTSFFFVGCNYTKIKDPKGLTNADFSLPSEKLSELSYGLLAQKVFIPKCISCHGNSGSVRLESYNDIFSNLSSIQRTVFEKKTMPKRSTLSHEEMAYLWNWIRLGAPENSQSGVPLPVADPILATYESINKHVFQNSCNHCHNPNGTGKRILLDKESLMNSPLELVLPGNADESGLVLSVERADRKRMPPAEDGYSVLPAEAKEAIRKWIQNGAKE